MPISSGDLARLLHPEQSLDVYLNTWEKREVASATITQAAFTYPVTDIEVGSASADWEDQLPGQLVEILDGSTLVTTGVLRRFPEAGILPLDAKAIGDPGRAQRITQVLATGQTVKVYDYFPLWTLFSVIRDGVFYKDYDVAFSSIFNQYPHPVVNLGPWRQAFVDGGGTATLTFSASNSFDWNELSLTYLWELPAAGATLSDGELTDAVIEVEFDPGFYLIRCTIANSEGNARIGVRPIWINEESGSDSPLSERVVLFPTADSQDLKGRRMGFSLYGNIDEDEVMDGGAVFLVDKGYFGGEPLEGGNYADNYIGFITGLRRFGDINEVTRLDIETVSPFIYSSELPCPPQVVQEVLGVPANWTEVSSGLATTSFVTWYVINYHCPSYMTLFDFFRQDDDRRKRAWNTSSNTMGPQVEEVASTIGAAIGCDSQGNTRILRNPSIEDTDFRDALDEAMEINADHIVKDVEVPLHYRPSVGEYTLFAFQVDGNETQALQSKAGDGAQGQGASKTQGPPFLVADQDELNVKAGNLMAAENNPTPEIPLLMNRNMDIFDPLRDYNRWWNLNVPAAYDPRGIGFSGRALAVGVERSWRRAGDVGEWVKDIRVTFQPETLGGEGALQPLPVKKTGSFNRLVGANADGFFYITDSWWTTYPGYSRQSVTISGTPVCFAQNPFDPTKGILVTTTNIYGVSGLNGTIAVSNDFTFRETESLRSLDISRNWTNAVVTTSYDDGCYVTYTANLETWETEAQYGSGVAQESGEPVETAYTEDFQPSPDAWTTITNGSHQSSGGRTDDLGCVLGVESGGSVYLTTVRIDLGAETTVVQPSLWGKDAAGGATRLRTISMRDGDDSVVHTGSSSSSSSTSWQQLSIAGTYNNVQTIMFQISVNISAGAASLMDDLEFTYDAPGAPVEGNQPPGIHVSSKTEDRVFTSGPISSGADMDGFISSDNGDNFSQISNPDIDPGDNLAAEIAVVLSGNNSSETWCIHGGVDSGNRFLKRVNKDNSVDDITPGGGYGPYKTGHTIQIYPHNPNFVIVAGTDDDQSHVGIWTSQDGGDTWAEAVTPTDASRRYERVWMREEGAIILYGTAGALGYSFDYLATIQNKRGDLAINFPSAGEFVGVGVL